MLDPITKLGITTAVIFVALTFLLRLSLLLYARFIGIIGVRADWIGMGILFGGIWVISFNVAWWILQHK